MNPYESGTVIDMNAAHKTVPTPVDADASICTLGVGDGTGSLFVHGSYEAIKRVQEIIFENERLRACFDWANGAAEKGWLPAQEVRKLRAQLAEAQRDAERWNRAVQCARLDQFGGFVVTPDEPAFASDVSLAFIREIDAAISAAKGESDG